MDEIKFINPKDIIGKKIRKNGNFYTIVHCNKHGNSLYLAFSNLRPLVGMYGKDVIRDEIKKLHQIDLFSYDQEIDSSLLNPTILRVNDIMLARSNPSETSDYAIDPDAWDDLFHVEIYVNPENKFDIKGHPFIKNGKPVTSYEKIDFFTEETQLRQIFINALPIHIGDEFAKRFREYCLSQISVQNHRYLEHTKQSLIEAEKVYKQKVKEYTNAVELNAKAQSEIDNYLASLNK